MHIFHSYKMTATHDEIIHTCRICGKEKREPWRPIAGIARPPRLPLKHKGEVKPNHLAFSCTECKAINVIPSWKSDGHRCKSCGGHIIPIGNAIVIR